MIQETVNTPSRRHMEQDSLPRPAYRRLQGYAFDPSLSVQLDTAVLNETIFRIPWENLQPGPLGEYVEVIDHDPASGCFYPPVNLDARYILATDGLAPSEGNPMFHQQFVYAVAMTTIKNFEKALGRWAFWAEYYDKNDKNFTEDKSFVQRLRIYPHALREANAFYSPVKKALLFGYFPASPDSPGDHIPGGMVFTCLSHDIIAHETTHALLDGMHRRFIEPTHPDALAFHEAFADIVALFQHFSFAEVLEHQIARTRGDLSAQNLLGELAQQFGKAIGGYGALRDAIGGVNEKTKKWEPKQPDPQDYVNILEPHARGSILVAAIFDAFLAIYQRRVADLFRIASGGTGVMPQGALHPDLVKRLAKEAATTSQHILNICVRALDYCPPVDINFGDYLRAVITADMELVPADEMGYRIALIEGFRRRGIYPRDIRTLSEENLRWPIAAQKDNEDFTYIAEKLRTFINDSQYIKDREESFSKTKHLKESLHMVIREGLDQQQQFEDITGLVLRKDHPESRLIDPSQKFKSPKFEVHSVRAARRVGPNGDVLDQVVISITQKRKLQKLEDGREFFFRGGCTLILDLKDLSLRYAIRKDIAGQKADARLKRQIDHLVNKTGASLRATYFGSVMPPGFEEPFALLHRSSEAPEPKGDEDNA